MSVAGMFKRAIAVLLCMIFILGSLSSCSGTEEEYYYTETEEGIVLLFYKGDALEVIVPSEINGKPVIEIGSDCFLRKNMTSITIPEGVKVINSFAFKMCTGLTDITIPKSVEHIGIHAFDNTTWYKNQEETFVIVGSGSLVKYNGVSETVIIPENVTDIACEFGGGSVKVSSITIPDGVKYIAGNAFVGTTWRRSLKDEFAIVGDGILIKYTGEGGDITIPEGVKSISGAFYDSSKVTSVKFPSTLERIESYSFACTSGQVFAENGNVEPAKISKLKSLEIPNSVKHIGMSAFYNCSALESVTLSENVYSINPLTFAFCDKLSSVSMSDKVAAVTSLAFGQTSSLKNVTLSKSLIFIGDAVFFASGLESVVLPEGCKYIAGSAFAQCASLGVATIPKSVDTVIVNAFVGCSKYLVIVGKAGSAAKEFADSNGYDFKKQ